MRVPITCTVFTLGALVIAVACSAASEDLPEPSITAQPASPTASPRVASPSPTPAATEPAAWSLPRTDATPGALLLDYGPREGWNSGRSGAAKGALLPLHPETAEELPGYRPLDAGQASHLVPSPDGRLAALVRHGTQHSGGLVHLIDLEAWADVGGFENGPPSDPASTWTLVWGDDGRTLYGLRFTWAPPDPSSEVWIFDAERMTTARAADLDFAVHGEPVLGDRALYLLGYRTRGWNETGSLPEGPPFIAAVDLESGTVEEVTLPDVIVGQRIEPIGGGGTEVGVTYAPAMAISRDGTRLFVAHANENLVTVIDLERLEVGHTLQPQRERSMWERFESWFSGQLVERAEAKGGGGNFSKQITASRDGRWLYITGTRNEMCEEVEYFPCVEGVPIGLQVIDAHSLALVAEFEGIGSMEVSPDGRWILGKGLSFDYATSDESSNVIDHGFTVVDAETLAVADHIVSDAVYWQFAMGPDSRHVYALRQDPSYREAMATSGRCEDACWVVDVLRLPDLTLVATQGWLGHPSLISLVPAP